MDDNEWIFDYVLQVLESDRFDADCMDFIDEYCDIFDSEDENKFIYTDIHAKFREHVESLMSSFLKDLDVSNDVFYQALEKGRNARDVNRAVFEKLLALDDFLTFKKIMVKRNVELQLESIQCYRSTKENLGQDETEFLKSLYYRTETQLHEPEGLNSATISNIIALPSPEELERRLNAEATAVPTDNEDELADILRSSLLEMELIHKQQLIEQMELEQALALSLLAEEERLEMLRLEAKHESSSDEKDYSYRQDYKDSSVSTAKDEGRSSAAGRSSAEVSSEYKQTKSAAPLKPSAVADEKQSAPVPSEPKAVSAPPAALSSSSSSSSGGLRPLATGAKSSSSSKALPPISAGNGSGNRIAALAPISSSSIEQQADALLDRKRLAEEAFKRNQDLLAEQRRQEEEAKRRVQADLASAVTSAGGTVESVDSAEEQRARYMKEQREKLLALKKAERDRKVQQEDERKRKTGAEDKVSRSEMDSSVARFIESQKSNAQGATSAESEVEEAERKRAQLRRALALHMKQDLYDSEETRLQAEEDMHFSDVDKKLRKIEQLQQTNQQRSAIMNEQLRQQQANLAKKTAASLRKET